jgi:hypothetical protein
MTVNFFGSAAPACSRLPIDVYPDAGIEALDCDLNVIEPLAGEGIVNQDGSCICDMCLACAGTSEQSNTSPSHFCSTVPVKQSTWGMIKLLYR